MEWVERLRAEQQRMVSTGFANARQGGSPSGDFLLRLMALSVPGYLILQVLLPLRFNGAWRKAALLPTLGSIPLILYTAWAFIAGSNLWPLAMLFLMPVGFVYLAALWLVRLVSGNRASRTPGE
ncbi:MAG: hypothetical protein ACOWWM_18085 [Desulfobacterales bacterium]